MKIKKMKVKRIKLYDGYITINLDPTRAFDNNILHLRKMGKDYYAKKRSKSNNRRPDIYVQDARTKLQHASQPLHYRR